MHLELLTYHIAREHNVLGERIVFKRGTDALTKMYVKVIEDVTEFVTKLTEEGDTAPPEVGVVISIGGGYEVLVHKWWDTSEVRITLRRYCTFEPLATWEVKQ